jgi:hypothetical protein
MNFFRGIRLDDQGMNIGLHQGPQCAVHQLVPLDLGFADEGITDNQNGIMTTTMLNGSGMSCMCCRIILNLEPLGRNRPIEGCSDQGNTVVHRGNTCLKGLMMTLEYTSAFT